ncbi:MAG: cation diffusion facilitator family transporter [Cyanobacteria bacterium HKST-UBA04]|nr:cation diffusion facilitator family transporter [Cyanobacteria bacterium HKST-UBA04]
MNDPHSRRGREAQQINSSASPVVIYPATNVVDYTDEDADPDPTRSSPVYTFSKLHGRRAVIVALLANVVIGSIKLFAGLIGRHSSMMSEAIHSYADAINSGFLLIGLQKGSRAADKTHPFGYGLETTLWAMLASLFMLLLGGWSISLGIDRLMHPEAHEIFAVSALVLLMSIVLEIGAVYMAASAVLAEQGLEDDRPWRTILRALKQVRYVVSPTTRFVFYEDSLAFLGALLALIAITMSKFGPHVGLIPKEYSHFPDAFASVVIGLMIVGLGVYLFLHNSRGLTGSSAGPVVERHIREYVHNIHGITAVLDLKTADYGMSGVVVHLRVEVDPDIAVKDVDDLTEHVRDRVHTKFKTVKEVLIEVVAHESDQEWRNQFARVVHLGVRNEVIKPTEEQMLVNVYEFTQRRVSDIMVPRTDVDCIEVTANLQEALGKLKETGFSRLPVYRNDLDDIVGIITLKTVMGALSEYPANQSIEALVKKVGVYPENKPISDLLEEFKRRKTKLALVVDEHGGFAGIATLEDLIEEIVGEIYDPDDEEEDWIEQPNADELVVSGRFEVEKLNQHFGFNIPATDFKTLGGVVFGLLGQEPRVEDAVEFEDLTLTVLAMDGHRVNAVRIKSPEAIVDKLPDDPLISAPLPEDIRDGEVVDVEIVGTENRDALH